MEPAAALPDAPGARLVAARPGVERSRSPRLVARHQHLAGGRDEVRVLDGLAPRQVGDDRPQVVRQPEHDVVGGGRLDGVGDGVAPLVDLLHERAADGPLADEENEEGDEERLHHQGEDELGPEAGPRHRANPGYELHRRRSVPDQSFCASKSTVRPSLRRTFIVLVGVDGVGNTAFITTPEGFPSQATGMGRTTLNSPNIVE